MTEKSDLYKCEICGNLVEVVIQGDGELVCCGKPMTYIEAGLNDGASKEKHVPVFVQRKDGKLEIKVGSEEHPMLPEHYIMFIEALSQDRNCLFRHYLYPNQKPEIVIDNYKDKITAREYCNIHGLWEATND